MPKVESGVYAIVNLVNNKRYVGSACNLKRRLEDHVRRLVGKYHDNQYLQNSWTKYGIANFELVILEYCSPELCVATEQRWIDTYKSYQFANGYNRSPTAGSSLGVKWCDEARQRRAKLMLGVPMLDCVKEKIRIALSGQPKSEQHKANLWKNRKGWKHSESSKKKTSETLRKLVASGLQLGCKGFQHTEETKAKMSKTGKGRPKSEEHKRKIAEANKGKPFSVEHCANLSMAKKGKPAHNKGVRYSEEVRERMRIAARNRKPRRA